MKTKEEWIKELDLEPHVEGGYFRQTYKAVDKVKLPDGRIRSLSTSILFLLTIKIHLTFIYSLPMKSGTITTAMH